MAQVYDSIYIGIIRQTQSSNYASYPSSSTSITEFSAKTTAQNEIIIDYSDGNHEIYQEMVLIPDGTDYIDYDETGAAPIGGDQLYNDRFVALYRLTDSGNWLIYKGTGSTIVFSTNKNTFINTLKQTYGIGRFRIFAQLRETSTHGFDLVP